MRFKKQMLLLCKFKSQCNKCITLQIALSPPQMIQKNEMSVRGCGYLCSQVLSPQTFMSLALANWSGHVDFCHSSNLKPNMMQNMDLHRQASVFQLSDRIRFLVPVQSDLRSSHPCREISTLWLVVDATSISLFWGISQPLVRSCSWSSGHAQRCLLVPVLHDQILWPFFIWYNYPEKMESFLKLKAIVRV